MQVGRRLIGLQWSRASLLGVLSLGTQVQAAQLEEGEKGPVRLGW